MAKKRSPYQLAEFPKPARYRDHLVVELRYEAPVMAKDGRFVGYGTGGEKAADNLNSVLADFEVTDVRQQFDITQRDLGDCMKVANVLPEAPRATTVTRRIESEKGRRIDPEDFFKSNFVQVVPKRGQDATTLARRLKRHDTVWDAHVAPVPVPPLFMQPPDIAGEGPFNLEPTQGYLYSAPDGIGAMDIWDKPGAKGEGVTVCDIEAGWNLSHEDLPSGIRLLGGTPLTSPEWRNHGTAVLGEMVSVSNAVGTVGICHAATPVVQSAVSGTVFNPAAAIDNAASKLRAGDVILIELHSELHPGQGDFVAMQYFPEVFTAIQAAVNKGVVVVEAAGNGNQDFDAAKYKDTGLQKDCGAIVVGAGVPPSNRVDFNGFGTQFPAYSALGVPRSRIFFSNYGKIVSVQGWGWHVTSTGYGDAQGGAINRQYTFRFSGTSSASPIVTGAVACLQGAATKKPGRVLTPDQVRRILIKTGTPQQDGPGVPVSTNHVGPQPDLVAALGEL